jgi:hypothetical protein
MPLRRKVCEDADATPRCTSPQNGWMRATFIAALAAGAIAALAGCGGDDEPAETVTVSLPPATSTPSPDTTVRSPTASGEADGTGPAGSATEDPRTNALERAAARTVRTYVDALNARDGKAVCELFAPGAIETVELPVTRGSCEASLSASIGYRDPRGLPVWEGTEITALKVELNGGSAKAVADVVTEFADRDEPSIETDIVYLTRRGPSWLLAKPSTTLYRAVGIADVPVTVLAPPK